MTNRRRWLIGNVIRLNPMNQPSLNPYAPPNVAATAAEERPRDRELLPLWIWLGVAAAISFLGTPADPISMLIALAYGLVSFWVGTILGSSVNVVIRFIPVVIWIIPAIALALMGVASYFIFLGLCYFAISVVMGCWASRRIKNGRLRIVLCFSAGYVLGSVVGVLGTVAGAVMGTILAKRSLSKPDVG